MSAMEIAYVLFDTRPDIPHRASPFPWRPRPFPSTLELLEESLAEQRSQQWQDGLDGLVGLLYPNEGLVFDGQLPGRVLSFLGLPVATGPPLAASPGGHRGRRSPTSTATACGPVQRRHDVSAHALSVGLVAGALARWAQPLRLARLIACAPWSPWS